MNSTKVKIIIIIWFIIYITLVVLLYPNPKNDTDSTNERSDLLLYTDYKTGCQYIATLLGGPTPRMDKNGKQVCGESNE